MGFWNVNGLSYTDNNNLHYIFKQSLIQNSNLDILAPSETFLCGDQHLSVPDYTWSGHNRTELHPYATRCSGGVGVLANLCMLNGRHRRSERRYQKQQQNELLQAHQQSQQDFWGQLGKTGIGQERKPQLPNGVRIDDVIHTDAEATLNKWERDFAELFSEQSNSFDDNHLIFVKNRLHEIEEMSSMVNHVIDEPNLTNLNCRITMKEIENVIKKSKNGKACGSDRIHAEDFPNVIQPRFTPAIIQQSFSILKPAENQQWENDLFNDQNLINGNKLRTYRCFKSRFITEDYVKLNIPRHELRILSMLRCGTLPLHVETGRWCRPVKPLDQRICTYCNQ